MWYRYSNFFLKEFHIGRFYSAPSLLSFYGQLQICLCRGYRTDIGISPESASMLVLPFKLQITIDLMGKKRRTPFHLLRTMVLCPSFSTGVAVEVWGHLEKISLKSQMNDFLSRSRFWSSRFLVGPEDGGNKVEVHRQGMVSPAWSAMEKIANPICL